MWKKRHSGQRSKNPPRFFKEPVESGVAVASAEVGVAAGTSVAAVVSAGSGTGTLSAQKCLLYWRVMLAIWSVVVLTRTAP